MICDAPVRLVAMDDAGADLQPSHACGYDEAPICGDRVCFFRHMMRAHASELEAFMKTADCDELEREKIAVARECEEGR